MKKHDADATYQFSCTICGKKFEKKDSVVAHKAKSHPEVLIAEALAANAGTLVTMPTAQVTQTDAEPVRAPEPDRLPTRDGASSDQTVQTVHFVSAPVPTSTQIVHMTFAALPPTPQLSNPAPSTPSISLLPQVSVHQADARPRPTPGGERKDDGVLWEGGNISMGGVWDAAGGAGEPQVGTDRSEETIQRIII